MGLIAKMLGDRRPDGLPPPTYSNDSVIKRIEREEKVDRETARAWFAEMLVFLDLCARSDDELAPPPNVDKAWHAFLLHTRAYEAYCRERFGRLVHHQPGTTDPNAYRRAYARRRAYDGLPSSDPMIWPVAAGAGVADLATPQGGSDGGWGGGDFGDVGGSDSSGGGCGGGGG